MSREKTIAAIGVADAEVAHLRLLVRKCADALDHRWRWGDETGADLLVVDVDSFAGQLARVRALASGVRCVIFSDEADGSPGLILRRPLRADNVVEVLNHVAAAAVPTTLVGSHTTDFYTRELGEHSADAGSGPDAVSVDGLDELLRPTPHELRQDRPSTASAQASKSPGPAPRSRYPAGEFDTARPRTAAPVPAATTRTYATRAGLLADTTPHDLRAYLDENLLRGPARFALPGAAPLVLDPKHRVAHAAGGMGALRPYLTTPSRLCDWQPLTSSELAAVRATQATLSYERLRWLDVLLTSRGQLAPHFDRGGSFRLARWIEIDYDHGRYFPIASAMLQPSRLHEIAAASSAPMADVFDFINACDAIGAIEWQPRQRDEPRARSLLDKLRRPFS